MMKVPANGIRKPFDSIWLTITTIIELVADMIRDTKMASCLGEDVLMLSCFTLQTVHLKSWLCIFQ